jgi:hypothetical protein
MFVVCVIDPLCAVICAVYVAGVGVVTVFEPELLPPPQPVNALTIRSAQKPKPSRIRVREAFPADAKITNAHNPSQTKIEPYRAAEELGQPLSSAQRAFVSSGRAAALTTPIVTVLVPDPATLAGEIEQVIAEGAEQVKATVAENEFSAATVSFVLVDDVPLLMVIAVGLAES